MTDGFVGALQPVAHDKSDLPEGFLLHLVSNTSTGALKSVEILHTAVKMSKTYLHELD